MDYSAATASSESASSRVVRFDQECVLIPEVARSKRPILVTKSYSLPLWRKRSASTGSDPIPTEEASPTLKVTLPSFLAKSPRSPSRGRQNDKPLSPCLVNRSPSSPDRIPRLRHRRPSLPLPAEHVSKLETVPLRACCTDCFTVIEESMKEGTLWEEKFSRGARRRRSSSASSDDFSLATPVSSPGFAAVASTRSGLPDGAVVTSRFQKALPITVDEVDKRRRSLELLVDRSPTVPPASPTDPSVVRSSPIAEEDEDQLFPLPSPRRTPSSSPAGSAEASPAPSPNASRIGFNGSRDSLNNSGSEEGMLPKSIARRDRCEKGFLMPEGQSPTKPIDIQHVRASSSPAPSPTSPVFSSHSRSATSPEDERIMSRHQPSSSPTKRRNPSFTFFKEALKGVSAMSGSNFS